MDIELQYRLVCYFIEANAFYSSEWKAKVISVLHLSSIYSHYTDDVMASDSIGLAKLLPLLDVLSRGEREGLWFVHRDGELQTDLVVLC